MYIIAHAIGTNDRGISKDFFPYGRVNIRTFSLEPTYRFVTTYQKADRNTAWAMLIVQT